jgi:hypothetical protein
MLWPSGDHVGPESELNFVHHLLKQSAKFVTCDGLPIGCKKSCYLLNEYQTQRAVRSRSLFSTN